MKEPTTAFDHLLALLGDLLSENQGSYSLNESFDSWSTGLDMTDGMDDLMMDDPLIYEAGPRDDPWRFVGGWDDISFD